MKSADTSTLTLQSKALFTLVLAALAVLGNYLSMPLFYGVSFIFGSIAVMLAVVLLGTVSAVLVAIAGGLYTVVLWGHPYALLIFTVEALVVCLLHRRGLHNLVLADLAYWLVIGVPLVLLFYRGVISMEWEAATLIALKQPLNSLFNALVAGLIILSLQLYWRGAEHRRLGIVRLPVLLFHLLLTTILLVGAVPVILEGYSQRIQQEEFMTERLIESARAVAAHLAADPDADPLHWQKQLEAEYLRPGQGFALQTPDEQTLFSLGEVASQTERAGQLKSLENGLSIWLPTGDIPTMPRWKQGRYQISVPVVGVDGVTGMVVEQAALPLVQRLERRGLHMFAFLAGLLLLGILVARVLSQWLVRPLHRLTEASGHVIEQIAEGVRPSLPESRVQEYASLGQALQKMSETLAGSFHELHQARDELELQVNERTAELARTADQLQGVLAAASEFSIIATDRDGLITQFNTGAEKMLGYAADDLVGQQTPALFHLAEEVAVRSAQLSASQGRPIEGFQAFVEIADQAGSETREWTYVHRGGRHIPVSLTVTQQTDTRGNIIGYLGIAEDITDRKQAETALMEQARHTQAILDNIVDGIVTIDQQGIIESFNPAATRIFGYMSDEVVGCNVSMLMPSPYREAHDGYLRNYQVSGVARIIGITREVEGQHKDGSLFPMELAISEITQHGQPLYVGMVRNIAERKRMERMKSEFVSTVSHELRTPLTSISGALGLIAGGGLGELSQPAQQMVTIAHKNSQRLTHLINDLLDMEKIAAGKMHFEMQVQPLMPLIEQALDSHQTYCVEQQVGLVLKSEATDARVRVDSHRLQQVLANLLSNAIKFSPEGGTVDISVQLMMGQVRVSVLDHGPGIPEAFRALIFEKFSQADSSDTRQKGGTGLGLSITRELVERMGGRIGFDSVEGEGASFWFELPLVDPNRPELVANDMALTLSNAPRILVVEDEPDVAEVLAMMLTRSGYRVDVVHTGQEALAALTHTVYDALSLDLMLPDISGLEIIRQLRQQPHTADLPIVVVSAKIEEGRQAINGEFSAIEWLAKPIDEQRLLQALEVLLIALNDTQPRILHVEDDTDLYQVIRTMVGGRFDFEQVSSLREARELIARERYDVIILDVGLPDGSGWDLLLEIRALQPETRVVILSGTEITPDEARKVEAVLLKSQVSPHELLDVLTRRIHNQSRRN